MKGLRGLALVLPIALLLSAPALGPWVAYSLPLVVMVAFWWDDWPGTRLGPNWSGWVDTLLIAAGGLVLLWIGGPATAVFGVLLQFTLVGEGWPLRDALPAHIAGPLALALSYAVALALEPLLNGRLIACIAAWQVLCFVVWHGLPIASRAVRLPCAHALVIGGGLLTYLLHVNTALAGCFVAGGLIVGMLFEAGSALAALLVAALLYVVLSGLGDEAWVTHVSLDALSVSIILHVAIGRRWPFTNA